MRVKCIDSIGMGGSLTFWKEYEVLKETDERYDIVDDNGDFVGYYKKRFSVIEEDKMENRVVRKLEDLDGLQNGFGTVIEIYDKIVSVWCVCEFDMNILKIDDVVKKLKRMGFNFEYKPLRSLEEVIEEMRVSSHKISTEYTGRLYSVYPPVSGTPYYTAYPSADGIGVYKFYRETAERYADELNEIIGVGK